MHKGKKEETKMTRTNWKNEYIKNIEQMKMMRKMENEEKGIGNIKDKMKKNKKN